MKWWDSPYINHFLQPDTLIPSPASPQSWNRYSYVANNPINASDPTGHKCVGEPDECLNEKGKPINGAGGFSAGKTLSWKPGDEAGSDFELPCGGLLNCQQTSEEYLQSLIPFSSEEVCQFFHLQPGICDRGTWNSLLNGPYASYPLNWFLQDVGESLSYMFGLVSDSIDFVTDLKLHQGIHLPVIGIFVDGFAQLSSDAGQGYTFWEQTSRVGISVFEGQVSAFAGASIAAVNGMAGAITGPADVIIVGSAYVITSSATSLFLNELNGAVIDRWPTTTDYIPYDNFFAGSP